MTIYFVTTDDIDEIIEGFENYAATIDEAQALQHNMDLDIADDVYIYEITVRKIPTHINLQFNETIPFKDKT